MTVTTYYAIDSLWQILWVTHYYTLFGCCSYGEMLSASVICNCVFTSLFDTCMHVIVPMTCINCQL